MFSVQGKFEAEIGDQNSLVTENISDAVEAESDTPPQSLVASVDSENYDDSEEPR